MKKLLMVSILFLALNNGFVLAKANNDPPCEGENKNSPACFRIELRESIGGTDVITGRTGMELVKNYARTLYHYGASIIGIICVLIIVFSGIQISAGGASSEMVTTAKTRIFNALLSLVMLFLTAMILVTINPGFFRGPIDSSGKITKPSGEPIEKSTLCKVDIPVSCYGEPVNGIQPWNNTCLADPYYLKDVCMALMKTEGPCEGDLQSALTNDINGNYYLKKVAGHLLPKYCTGKAIEVDGKYGNCTVAAFKAFQADPDGCGKGKE